MDNPVPVETEKIESPKTSRTKGLIIPHWLYAILLVYIVLAILDDLFISPSGKVYLTVSDTYIDVVFASLCTIAVLGNAILSIVIGSFSNKIYGLTVKEILAALPQKGGIVQTVILSFCAIIAGIPAYAFGFCTTVTALAVSLTCLLALSSWRLWSLLSNDEYQDNVLKQIMISDQFSPEFYLSRWYSELEKAIQINDQSAQNQYIELIKGLCDKVGTNIAPALDRNARDVFPIACEHLGFVDAYQKILCLSPMGNRTPDALLIANAYCHQIMYCDEQHITSYRIPETVEDILERMGEDRFATTYFAYEYYRALKDNQILSSHAKDSIMKGLFEKLCYLRDGHKGATRENIILNIAKKDVFENEDVNDRQHLWELLLYPVFNTNRFSIDRCYVSLIAQLFRALYFYSNLETETLNQPYRTNLATLFQYGNRGKNNETITLERLVTEKSDTIIIWLADDLITCPRDQGSIFDYYAFNAVVKNAIWTQKNRAWFAFAYYLIAEYHFPVFPLLDALKSDDYDIELRTDLCRCIVNLFDCNGKLTEDFKSFVLALRKFVGTASLLPDDFIAENFRCFNEMLQALNEENNATLDSSTAANTDEFNRIMIDSCASIGGVEYCDTISLDNAPVISVTQNVHKRSDNNLISSAKAMAEPVKEMLNRLLHSTLPPVSLSFDQKGVHALHNKLKDRDYKIRNYTFVNDWGLLKQENVRESEEYLALAAEIQTIQLLRETHFYDYFFLKDEKIMFNVKALSYRPDAPTDQQCEKYLAQCKIADGKYQIDGAVYHYDNAVQYIKKFYIVEYIDLSIATNINEQSGFRVKFDYR